MKKLLNYFYHLPYEFIQQCLLLLSLWFIRIRQRFAHCRWFRRGVWIALCIWLSVTLCITLLSRTPGAAHSPELIPFHSYRKLLATGNTEIIRSIFMNIVLFYPAGLLTASLLPEKWPYRRRMLTTAIACALFSLMIEYAQFFFALGEPEIDDLIYNTVGAIIGTLPIMIQNNLYESAP